MLTVVVWILVLLMLFYFLRPLYEKYANKKPAKHPSVLQRQAFEDYIHQTLFPSQFYYCENKREQYSGSTGSWISVTDFPGLGYKTKSDGYSFYVKTKYRAAIPEDGLMTWVTSEDRFEKFKRVDDVHPVFIVIGTGGETTAPEQLYLIPIAKIHNYQIDLKSIQKYRIKNEPVDYAVLSVLKL